MAKDAELIYGVLRRGSINVGGDSTAMGMKSVESIDVSKGFITLRCSGSDAVGNDHRTCSF